jgi:glycosyltransferase involved in cell wall biosynthesis
MPTEDSSGSIVSVIVRFHDVKRLVELDRALFCLVNQTHRPVEAVIVLQNLAGQVASIKELAGRFDWLAYGHSAPVVVNHESSERDCRSQLLNVGVANARGRYLAVLDCDDYLYSYAYEHIIAGLCESGAAIGFGGIAIRYKRVIESFIYTTDAGGRNCDDKSYDDLFFDNFCPIHSFVADRSIISSDDLKFDDRLTRLEDYDLFLRICSKYRYNFKTRSKCIGVYNHDIAGDNSVLIETVRPTVENQNAWFRARAHTWRLKASIREAAASLGSMGASLQFEGSGTAKDARSLKGRT